MPFLSFSQLGGNAIYEFTNTPASARENALGGNIISLSDGDVSLALKNPSLLDTSFSEKFSGTWGSLHVMQTNIGLGSFGYAQTINNRITVMGGIQFVNYGRFSGYDEAGNSTGNFFASDYEIIMGGSYNFFKNFYAGINIKPILSYLESYSSYGLLTDIGVSYINPNNLFSSSVLIKNAGFQLTTYTSNNKESIPYSIDFGFTKKLKHAPFRFSVTYQDLQQFDLSYTNVLEQQSTLINQTTVEKETFITNVRANFMKHVTLSSEILLLKNFHALIGYNYRKSKEMSFGASKKGVGISLGFDMKISCFTFSYGWAKQHVAGGTNYLSLNTDINTIYSKFSK